MASLSEETLNQQEEELLAEQERQRLLEEARLAMQIQDAPPYELEQPPIQDAPAADFLPPPQPVWAGSSTADIDAFNRDPGTLMRSDAPNAQQYAQEVARAQAGSGFINADVGPSGNVITPGYDPSAALNLKAKQEAIKLQRNQFYGSLLAGGATPAEAFRAANARYPQIPTFTEAARIEDLATRRNFVPRTRVEGGRTLIETRPGFWQQAKAEPTQKFVAGKVTPIATREAGDIDKEIGALRHELSVGTKPGLSLTGKGTKVPLTEAERATKEERIKTLQQSRKALLDRPEFNPAVDQPGWNAMRDRFNTEGGAPVAATVPPRPPVVTARTPEGMRIGRSETSAAPPKGKEIVRFTADGKKAYFDAETKKLLRIE